MPQGSVLGPILYLFYTSDLPTLEDMAVVRFAHDTALLVKWTNQWRIRLTELKSIHVNLPNKKVTNFKDQ